MDSSKLLNMTLLAEQLKLAPSPINPLKQALQLINQQQSEQFSNQKNIIHLVYERSLEIDNILSQC